MHFAILFAGIFLGYLLTFSGSHYGRIGDGKEMFETALSIYEFRELSIYNGDFGKDGDNHAETYSKYGIGFPLILQVPLFVADHLQSWTGWKRGDYLFPFTNLMLNLLTALLIAGAARRLEFSWLLSYGAALAFAFGSFAWPYISFDFSEPLQAFCLALAFWALLRAVSGKGRPWPWLLLTGFALGFSVLTKSFLLVTIPTYAIYLWLKTPGNRQIRLRRLAIFAGPLIVCGIAAAILNFARFGSILESGYKQETFQFTTPLSTGLYGLLMSPCKGMIFYAPVTLFLPLSAYFLFKRRRSEFVFLCLLSVSLIVPVALWWSWEGGSSWGPRLLFPLLPCFTLFSFYILDLKKSARYGFAVLLPLGMAINLLGVLFYFTTWGAIVGSNGDLVPMNVVGRPAQEYQVRNGTKYFQAYVAANYVSSLSPILGHAWVLKWRYFDSPFPVSKLVDQIAPPKLPFGPITINFDKLKEIAKSFPSLVRDLQTAELVIPDKIGNRRADLGPFPIRNRAFLDHGDRFLALKDFPRAYDAYRRAYNLDYDDPMILTKLGFASFQVGKFEEGNGYFEKYLSARPADLNARLFYAQALDTTRQFSKALGQYQQIRKLAPNHPQISQIDQRITALQQVLQGSKTGR
jgi:hypothetical protein